MEPGGSRGLQNRCIVARQQVGSTPIRLRQIKRGESNMTRKAGETDENLSDPRKDLPSVSDILQNKIIQNKIDLYSKIIVLDATNNVLQGYREALKPGDKAPNEKIVIGKICEMLDELKAQTLKPVVNATGIILHTNLGRACLPISASKALSEMHRCSNIQTDMKTGARGKRHFTTEFLLRKITGAEAAIVVNNNAAATFFILAALCKGREVIISRGQLIEIGGSFRLPDCIRESGATMVEVGTTNKTHLRDYEAAINDNTAAILRCNPSNYRIIGFTSDVPTHELISLKKNRKIIVIDDLGCGALIDLSKFGLPKEPTVLESIAAGADIVCFSGDKLISGPQAGIIVGKKDLIAKLKKHPLSRMLRICKLTDIALQETLRLFLDPASLHENNPTLKMLSASEKDLREKAVSLKSRLECLGGDFSYTIEKDFSEVGGGSLPGHHIDTCVLTITSLKTNPQKIANLLRHASVPVIARIRNDTVVLDMRTLLEGDEERIISAVREIFF